MELLKVTSRVIVSRSKKQVCRAGDSEGANVRVRPLSHSEFMHILEGG